MPFFIMDTRGRHLTINNVNTLTTPKHNFLSTIKGFNNEWVYVTAKATSFAARYIAKFYVMNTFYLSKKQTFEKRINNIPHRISS